MATLTTLDSVASVIGSFIDHFATFELSGGNFAIRLNSHFAIFELSVGCLLIGSTAFLRILSSVVEN